MNKEEEKKKNVDEVEKNTENKYENAQVSEKKYMNISRTLVWRLALISLGSYFTYFMGCSVDKNYYGLYVFSVIIILDLVYVCIFNGGIDFKWKVY